MRTLPAGLEAHLATGATTLCWCWRMERRDGVVLGFTDHDRDLSFDGVTYEAEAGMTASELSESVGLGVDNLEVTSAVSSGRLDEKDLVGGVYDDARIEIYRVNWQDVSQRLLMRSGSLGEVKRSGAIFSGEVRGLAHYLHQPKGRLFQHTCDADLGDGRCKVNLNLAQYHGNGVVETVHSNKRFSATGLSTFEAAWFARGLITFTSGAADGQEMEVKRHTISGGTVILELWQDVAGPLVSGQTFTVTAGCDKAPATCREKFSNMINFQGFPHMPGPDFVLQIAGRQQSSS